MEKVLIVGAAGFVGKYLAQEFLNHEYTVYGSDLKENHSLPQEVTYIRSDLLNEEQTKTLIVDIQPDILINLAAVSSVGMSWEMPQTTVAVNVIGTINILEAVKDLSKPMKLMFVGSSEEYATADELINEDTQLDANNPYGISKVVQESFADIYRKRYGMQIYCVRTFNHTGVGQEETFALPSFCKQVAQIEKSGKPGVIRVGNLDARRDFSDVRDIVRAYRMILENGMCESVYNVGSGKAYRIRELLEYIISLSTQDITIEVDPERFRPADTPVVCCDYSRIKKEVGWEAQRSIFDTLQEMYREVRKH